MGDSRREQLLQVLQRSTVPVSGPELSGQLGVSTRSVRTYVQELNRLAGATLIHTSHRGYSLDGRVARRWQDARAQRHRVETPVERLYYIARRLAANPEGQDVYELAEMLAVSDSTIEADLSKVRGLVQEFDLSLGRDRSVVHITGSERNQRRLVRQLLVEATRGVSVAGMSAAAQELHTYDTSRLARPIREAFAGQGITLQEYTLNDLALHVAIALTRLSAGRLRDPEELVEVDPTVVTAVDVLSDSLEDEYGLSIPSAERVALVRLVLTRIGGPHDPAVVGDTYLTLVSRVLKELSERYLIELGEPQFAINLSLHVRNMVARARDGSRARNPLGASFKQSHPLVLELAVFVASRIEAETGIELDEDEVVFLGFHLGALLQKTLDTTNQVTLACVAPKYYDMHETFVKRLEAQLGDSARIVQIVTTLDHEWDALDADLVVSTVPLPPDVGALLISPVPSRAELDDVLDAVRAARQRKISTRIRWTLLNLLDPRLFTRVQSTTQHDALEQMTAQLTAEAIVGAGFLDDVLERERLSATAFGGAIAVPHSMHMDSRRTAISVLVSETPIEWAGSPVRLVVLFALSPTGRHMFREVLDDFIAVLADSTRISSIVDRSISYDDFIEAVFDALPS